MKKLNNKGYMLVEIIIASVLALFVAWFLIDVTVKLVNKNNDYYLDSVLLVDKNIITKEIMDDVNESDLNLYSVVHDEKNNEIELKFKDKDNNVVTRIIKISNTVISYIYGDDEENDIKYKRVLNEKLKIGDIEIKNDPGLLKIDIPAYTNFSDENYGINLMIKYNGELEEANLPEYYKYEKIEVISDIEQKIDKIIQLDNNITEAVCEIIYDDDYTGTKSAIVENCIPQPNKKLSITVNNGEIDKEKTACVKDSEFTDAKTTRGDCIKYGVGCWANYKLRGDKCYHVLDSTKTHDPLSVCDEYDTKYSCDSSEYSLVNGKCYKCPETGFVLNSDKKCDGLCFKYTYKVKIKYK